MRKFFIFVLIEITFYGGKNYNDYYYNKLSSNVDCVHD